MSAYATITTYNPTDYGVWVTIYDLGKTQHLDYGDVGTQGQRDWRSGNYCYGSFYHVRYEIFEGKARIFDTDIQISPQYNAGASDPRYVVTQTGVTLNGSKDAGFYLSITNPSRGKGH